MEHLFERHYFGLDLVYRSKYIEHRICDKTYCQLRYIFMLKYKGER